VHDVNDPGVAEVVEEVQRYLRMADAASSFGQVLEADRRAVQEAREAESFDWRALSDVRITL
jgi:hypothetical protein